EVASLAAAGVKEVTLLGQTVNSWHEPEDARPGLRAPSGSRFAALLRRIAAEVPALARLRYTSPHPRHVTPALIAAHAELPILPAHVHLPAQSGSDRMLRRMSRRYTRAAYLERARALQGAREGLTLSTDLIVGFPGESDDDFEQTIALVREVGFVAAFCFKFSPRPGTPALGLGDDVPEEVKDARLRRLFEVLAELQGAHLASLVGTRTRVLVEGPSEVEGRFMGRSERGEIVHLEPAPGMDPVGQLVEIEIHRAYRHSLFGAPPGIEPRAEPPRKRALPLLVGGAG
ncbi:MAG: radical SAM protein, partial [Myxococcales bacterium]|nr:radical SAM protein [Myxococcales bacterium]